MKRDEFYVWNITIQHINQCRILPASFPVSLKMKMILLVVLVILHQINGAPKDRQMDVNGKSTIDAAKLKHSKSIIQMLKKINNFKEPTNTECELKTDFKTITIKDCGTTVVGVTYCEGLCHSSTQLQYNYLTKKTELKKECYMCEPTGRATKDIIIPCNDKLRQSNYTMQLVTGCECKLYKECN